jgi:four helix bundle protein
LTAQYEGGSFMSDEPSGPQPSAPPRDLRERTRDYAVRIIRLYCALPKSLPAQVIGKQMLRSGTSVAAQYREAHRAKSTADFVNKLDGVLQELDETDLWLDLLVITGMIKAARVESLRTETSELIAIFVASSKRAKSRPKS